MADKNSFYCPNCHQKTNVIVRTSYGWPKDQGTTRYEIGECNGCDYFVLVRRYGENIVQILPSPLPKPIHEKTPEFLKSDLIEANLCYSVGANRAAVTLARRVLQSCCFDKGAPDKRLQEQIDWLLAQQIITKDLHDWALEVKATGNDAAHPPKKAGEDTQVTREDADDILLLLEKFIEVLYIAPALAAERRAKRNGQS